MKAVIMVGGLGKRLWPITDKTPKPLLPVGDKSLIEITISHLKKHGFDDIILATNYKSEMFESFLGDGKKFGVKITYSKEDKPLGTAGPLSLVKDKLTEHFLVINGDILTDLNLTELKKFHISNNAELTLVTKQLHVPFNYGVVRADEDGKIVNIDEKPELNVEINAGIYFLNPSILSMIKDTKLYHMTDLLQDMIRNKRRMFKFLLEGYWLDIGQKENYEQAQKDITAGIINDVK